MSNDDLVRAAFNTLSRRVVADKGIVTYRLLSRLTSSHIHVHLAKQILFAFYQQNRAGGGVHATYLITGILRRDGGADGGKMDVDDAAEHNEEQDGDEEEEEQTSVRTAVILAAEEDLECERVKALPADSERTLIYCKLQPRKLSFRM
jgi:hypothetical protein